jgi:hypothetical protein
MTSCSDFLPKGLFVHLSKVSLHEGVGEHFSWLSSEDSGKNDNLDGYKRANNHNIAEIWAKRICVLSSDVHLYYIMKKEDQ